MRSKTGTTLVEFLRDAASDASSILAASTSRPEPKGMDVRLARRRLAGAVVLALVTAACSATTSTTPSAIKSPVVPSQIVPTSSPLASAIAVSGGCGATQVYRGGMPAWLSQGIQGLTGVENAPYALAGPTPIAALLLVYPPRTGTNTSKILWVVGTPRNNAPLTIRVNPSGAAEPAIAVSRPADSGPGEIYPDGVSVPTSGCWHFKLQWATGSAELDLSYSS